MQKGILELGGEHAPGRAAPEGPEQEDNKGDLRVHCLLQFVNSAEKKDGNVPYSMQ